METGEERIECKEVEERVKERREVEEEEMNAEAGCVPSNLIREDCISDVSTSVQQLF